MITTLIVYIINSLATAYQCMKQVNKEDGLTMLARENIKHYINKYLEEL